MLQQLLKYRTMTAEVSNSSVSSRGRGCLDVLCTLADKDLSVFIGAVAQVAKLLKILTVGIYSLDMCLDVNSRIS